MAIAGTVEQAFGWDWVLRGAMVPVLLIACADDPGMHSSQNEQDSRNYAKFARAPMLEPSDSEEAMQFAATALVGGLLHDPDRLMVAEELDVGLEDAEIRVRHDVVTEIYDVIPDVNVGRNVRPAFHVFHEPGASVIPG